MPAVTADQIGNKFDILVATRDGSTLPCLDRNKATQQLSQVAYMHSTNPQKMFHEATEIARKDQLTQLASAQVIDRDFDAWPQIDQKDWSDGQGQRVFSGQGEALGTVSNRSTKYWDGLGVLWPTTDYVPQQFFPYPTIPSFAVGADLMNLPGLGPAAIGGTIGWLQTDNVTGNQFYVAFNVRSQALTNFNLTTPTLLLGAARDLFSVGSSLYFIATDSANRVTRINVDASSAFALATLPGAPILGGGSGGLAGNRSYVIVPYLLNVDLFVRIFDVTSSAGAPVGNAFTDIRFDGFFALNQTVLLGDTLYVSLSNAADSFIVAISLPSYTTSMVAKISGYSTTYMVSVAGGLFLIASNLATVSAAPVTAVEMFLLQGNNLQDIGPLPVQSQGLQIRGILQPVGIGPYAFFGALASDATLNYLLFYAYDALRGRLFKVHQIVLGAAESLFTLAGQRMAVATLARPNLTTTAIFEAGVATSVGLSSIAVPGAGSPAVRYFCLGGINPNRTPARKGVQIVSSVIDFTSSQLKLYRQLKATFSPLVNDASVNVTLDAWFDQDPDTLAVVPDFTATLNGVTASGQKTLSLYTNRIATKVVYRLTTTGGTVFDGSGNLIAAPKPLSVAVRIATGWSIHFFADLSRQALCNDNSTYCFSSQVNGVDEISAYNFLRQLWRLKGGECTLTLPNGDVYNALIQLEDGTSSKPFGISAQGVQTYQEVYELKFREDV